MSITRRDFLTGVFAKAKQPQIDPIHHLLNRITWGVRPEEIARAQAMGAEAYLDEQLHPEQIDDSALDERLRQLPLLKMDRHTLYSIQENESRAWQAMVKGMIWRAVHSKRQLFERVVEFWSDHFNISGEDFTADNLIYQQDVIRKHAFGRFRDLLTATAKSPAMLYYLDNYINYAEAPNENYARELFELHTLGVDGGYTEKDVKEAARAFTGWTVHDGTRTGFYFEHGDHDGGAKTVLGHHLPAGRGIEDGLHVLAIAADHPATARFVCGKMARRFVSDEPPASLVDSMVRVWQQTNGEITAILRHLFLSDAFAASAGQKMKRPLHFFIGALRTTGTEILDWWTLEQILLDLGQMPYNWGPPDGYPDVAAAWMSTNGLLARWNTAMLLTHTAYEDMYESDVRMKVPLLFEQISDPKLPQTAVSLINTVAARILGAPLADPTPFINYVTDGGKGSTPVTPHLLARKLASLYGLMLASPQYQWS